MAAQPGGSDRFAKFLEPVFAREAGVLQRGRQEPLNWPPDKRKKSTPARLNMDLCSFRSARPWLGWGMAGPRLSQGGQRLRGTHRHAAPPVYDLLYNKYYVDEAYDYAFTGRRKVGDVRLGVMGAGRSRRHGSTRT